MLMYVSCCSVKYYRDYGSTGRFSIYRKQEVSFLRIIAGFYRDVIGIEFYELSVIHDFGVDMLDISVIRYITKTG